MELWILCSESVNTEKENKMKLYFRVIFAWTTIVAFLLSGCSAQEPPTFSITQPGQGSILPSGNPVEITLSSRYNTNNYNSIRWEIYDNGVLVGHDVAQIGIRDIRWAENGPMDGVHHIYARAQAFSNGANQSQWLTTPDLCYWVGDNAPADFCSIQTIVQPSTAATATAVITPIVINRPDNNGNNNGGNGNPGGGATGCAVYGDKTSCNLAGCSWNGSSCTVTP
jgi:hypothetical protein